MNERYKRGASEGYSHFDGDIFAGFPYVRDDVRDYLF